MADEQDYLGDLTVNITGDFSELQDAIDEATTAASAGAETISDALQAVVDASGLAGRDLEIFQEILQSDQDAGIALAQSLQDIADSASSLGDEIAAGAQAALGSLEELQASGEATAIAWDDLATSAQYVDDTLSSVADDSSNAETAIEEISTSAHEAEGGLQGMAEGFLAVGEALAISEALFEFVQESIEVYGETQNVITSLQLLGATSSEAEETISGLSDMSLNLAIPFGDLEQAARRLTVAFQGVEGIDINDVLLTAANSAALTGKSFDQVTTALQRVEVTGAVTARQLLQLGVTWQQLADTAGTSVGQVQALLKKGGQDATADLQLVMETINSMASGAAQAQAQTILGQITVLKNQVTLLFDAIGQDIAPAVATVVGGISEMITVARSAATAFQQLPQSLQSAIVVAGLLAAAAVPLAGALGAAGLAVAGLNTLLPSLEALMATLAGTAAEDAVAEGAAAAATTAHGVASTRTAAEVEALTIAEEEQSGVIATQMGLFGEETVITGAAATQMGLFEGATVEATTATGLFGTGLLGTIGTVAAVGAGVVILIEQFIEMKNILPTLGSQLGDIGGQLGELAASMGVTVGATNSADSAFVLFEGNARTAGAATTSLGTEAQQAGTVLGGLGATFVTLSGNAEGSSTAMAYLKTTFETLSGPIGIVLSELQLLSGGITEVTGKFPVMAQAAADAANKMQASMEATARTQAAAAQGSVQAASDVAQAAQKEISALDKLGTAATQAQAVLTAMQTSFQTGLVIPGTKVVATFQDVQAATVNLTKAQTALAGALDTTKASGDGVTTSAKPLKDSLDALSDSATKNQQAFLSAYDTYNQLLISYDNGEASFNGVQASVENLATAWKNLSDAQAKATGTLPAWVASESSVAAAVNTEATAMQKLQNTVTQTSAVLAALQQSWQTGVVVPGTAVVGTAESVAKAYLDQQKAIDALQKATDASAYSLEDWTGAAQNANTVMVNGKPVAVALSDAVGDMKISTDASTVSLGANTDGIKNWIAAQQGATVQINGQAVAVGNLTGAIDTNTTSKKGAKDASQQLTDQMTQENRAWAMGAIAVQAYNSDTVNLEQTLNDTGTAIKSTTDLLKECIDAQTNLGEVTNEAADALLAEAAAADDAADAIENLNNQTAKSGKGGQGGGSLSSYLEDAIGIAQNPATGGALGGGGVNQSQIDAMAQELANATNQVVTTLDGQFIPATQSAANEANIQALYTAQQSTATTANTTATTANTTATTANTTATTSSTTATTSSTSATTQSTYALLGMATGAKDFSTGVSASVDSLGNVTLAITDATGAVTDFTESAADATDGANNWTTAGQTSTAALQALSNFLTQQSNATQTQTTATEGATTALDGLSSSVTEASASLGQLSSQAQQSLTPYQQQQADQLAYNQQLEAAFQQLGRLAYGGGGTATPLTSPAGVTYTTTAANPASYLSGLGNGGPGSGSAAPIDSYGPSSYGYEGFSTPVNTYPSTSAPSPSGVNLQINVTGNTVASDSSIQMLASKVGSAVITQLRTVGGLKL